MDLKDKKWSFSAVKLFEQCPFAFYLKYIEDQVEDDNAFAQHGTFAHKLLERCLTKEIVAFELADIYEQEYAQNVTKSFPYANIAKSFYEKTLQYFLEFEGFDGEIVSVEEKLEGKFGDYNFIGYADLILKDDKGLYIVDHKSHAAFKSKAERESYFKQLYLYAECLKQKYGEYPYKLVFNMFRVPKMEVEILNPEKGKDSVEWFVKSVDKILANTDWDVKTDNWYCSNLCGFDCLYRGK